MPTMAERNSNNNTTNNNTWNNNFTNSGSNNVSGGVNLAGLSFNAGANLTFNSTTLDEQASQPWTVPRNDPDEQSYFFQWLPIVQTLARAMFSGRSTSRGTLCAITILAYGVGDDIYTEGDISILQRQIEDSMSHNVRPVYEEEPSEIIVTLTQRLSTFGLAQGESLNDQQREHSKKQLKLLTEAIQCCLQRCLDSELGRRSSMNFGLKLWIRGPFSWHAQRPDFDSVESFRAMMLNVSIFQAILAKDTEALLDLRRARLALCATKYGKRSIPYIHALGDLGMSLETCDIKNDAVAKLSEAVTLMTDSAIADIKILDYRFSLSAAYFGLKQWSDAAQVLEKIIEDVRGQIFPKYQNLLEVKLHLGATYHFMDRPKDVIATLEPVLVDVDFSQLESGAWTELLIPLPTMLTPAYVKEKRYEDVVKLIGPSGPADASGHIPDTVDPWQKELAKCRLAFSYSMVGEWKEAIRILQVLKEDHSQRYGVDSEEAQRVATALGHLKRRRVEQSAKETSEQLSRSVREREQLRPAASRRSWP